MNENPDGVWKVKAAAKLTSAREAVQYCLDRHDCPDDVKEDLSNAIGWIDAVLNLCVSAEDLTSEQDSTETAETGTGVDSEPAG